MCHEHGRLASQAPVIECPSPPPKKELPVVQAKVIPTTRTDAARVLPPVEPSVPTVTPPPTVIAQPTVVTPPPRKPVIPPATVAVPPVPVPIVPKKAEAVTEVSADIQGFIAQIPPKKPGNPVEWYRLIERLASLVQVTINRDRRLSDSEYRRKRLLLIKDALWPRLRIKSTDVPSWFWG